MERRYGGDNIPAPRHGGKDGEVTTADNRLVWNAVDTAPENIVLETKIHDDKGLRNETRLIRRGRLWYLPDCSMYVYYTPTHWRYPPLPA